MRFVKTEIRDFIPFQKVSNIQSLTINWDSNTQVIIGTNGSGKSQLMGTLTPRPLTKRRFGPKGFLRHEIEHRGVTYITQSDFSEKSSPHSFWIVDEHGNETNLNEGGSTNVQDELCVKHFGLTQTIDRLVHMSIDFCKMSEGQRESLLTKLNIYDIEFITVHQKNVSSKLRALKANISMLTERKTLLESKMMASDEIAELCEEKDYHKDQLHRISLCEFKIKDTLKDIQTHGANTSLEDAMRSFTSLMKRTRGYCDEVVSQVAYLRDGLDPQEDLHTQSTRSQIVRQTSQQELSPLDEQLMEQAQEIDSITREIVTIMDDVTIDQVEVRLKALSDELSEIKDHVCPNPIAPRRLEEAGVQLEILHNVVSHFVRCDTSIVSRSEYNKRIDIVHNTTDYINDLKGRIDHLIEERDSIINNEQFTPGDIPEHPCAKNQCPLYYTFMMDASRTQGRIDRINTEISSLENTVSEKQTWCEGELEVLSGMGPYMVHLDTLEGIYRACPELRETMPDDVLLTLATSPVSIYTKASTYVEQSKNTHRVQVLENEIVKEELHKAKLLQSSTSESDRLKWILEKKKDAYEELHKKADTLLTTIASCDRVDQKIRTLEEFKHNLEHHDTQFQDGLNHTHQCLEIHVLNTLLKLLRDSSGSHHERLGQIEMILKENDNLRSRYDEEVIALLGDKQKEYKKYENLLSALDDIPKQYEVTFLNDVITLANKLIAQVFTYDFEIEPKSMDKALTYEFPIIAKKQDDGPDISEGSSAQQEMVNFTLNIALKVITGFKDYPIMTDECGSTFDPAHKQRLLSLLSSLADHRMMSQLFIINHHAAIHEGLSNAQTLVLEQSNVMVPPVYNEHVTID